MSGLFGRHGRAFARAIRQQEYQRTEDGILLPRLGAFLKGEVCARTRHGEVRGHNLITNTGLLYLAAYATGVGPFDPTSNAYIGLMGGNCTPAADWDAVDFCMLAQELGDAPEGYSEATRVNFVGANEGGGSLDNSSSPASFTMQTASTIDVWGCGLILVGTNAKRGEAPLTLTLSAVTDPVDTGTGDTGIPAYGWHRQAGGLEWYDPNGDDFFDSGLGYWVDPGGESYGFVTPAPLGAVAIFPGAPLVHADNEVFNLTWAFQVAT